MSWLRCEDEAVAVFDVVDAFVLAAGVVAPVGVEVSGGDDGAEFQDGELALRSAVHALGLRYRVNTRPLPHCGEQRTSFSPASRSLSS